METTMGYEIKLIEQDKGRYDLFLKDVAYDDNCYVIPLMTKQEMLQFASLLIQAAEAQEGE